jgi:hypothetical protein
MGKRAAREMQGVEGKGRGFLVISTGIGWRELVNRHVIDDGED